MAKTLFSLDRHQPQVMAVLNVTPDSFSDGGSHYQQSVLNLDSCRRRVDSMIAQGASIIDIGGESTRPGAAVVSEQEELDRVLPLVEVIRDYDVVLSLDSSTPRVMREAVGLGVDLINDVRALQRDGALEMAASLNVPVCLMHMQGEPSSMQKKPHYSNVVDEVVDFLQERVDASIAAGIDKHHILLDPGFGFGKTLPHNRELLVHLQRFVEMQLPVLVGMSRKTMVSQILGGRETHQRMIGSVALAMLAVQRGAWIVRVHDVAETVDALRVAQFIEKEVTAV